MSAACVALSLSDGGAQHAGLAQPCRRYHEHGATVASTGGIEQPPYRLNDRLTLIHPDVHRSPFSPNSGCHRQPRRPGRRPSHHAGDLDADLAHFAASFDERLPVVDFGCGDGRQTRFLGRYFATVCGVDISPAAVDRAPAADNPANVSFRILDARDPGAAARLHRELGDVNVYIRGVLQALPLAARPRAVETIERLLGATGTLFAKELPPAATAYFAAVAERHGLPPGLARIMRLIPPGEISEPDLVRLFPTDHFDVMSTGNSHIRTVNTLPNGEVITVPAIYALVRPRHARTPVS
jgi:SAM-dependent methyltransferase